jgi:carbamoyl-phosphate synthase large subunit
MSPQATMQKVLIIGSGPIRIGQTGAFDDAACRACNVFRHAGLETIMVHCDPSSLAADVDMADRTYMVPLSVSALTDILLKERPDALLPTVGGPKALQVAKALADSGLLNDCGIRLLGVSAACLALIDDPGAFSEMAAKVGLSVPDGRNSTNISDAAAQAERIGYPVFVRAAEPGGALRHGTAFNVEELRQLVAGGRLPSDTTGRFRVETALSGCLEVEVAVLRDSANGLQVAAMAENLDPVGIHSGDSTAVTPPQTIDRQTLDQIEKAASALAEKAGVTGIVNFKIAVQATTGELLPLAMDIGYCRTTAFLAKALALPLATIHARLSLGMDLCAAVSGAGVQGAAEQTGKTVAVRLPRWEFERFPGEALRLDARMKSTSAVMGLGHTFLQAYLKAQRACLPRQPLPAPASPSERRGADIFLQRLVLPAPDRLAVIQAALTEGASPEDVAAVTGIARHWIQQLADLVDLQAALLAAPQTPLPSSLADRALQAGFTAAVLAYLLKIPEDDAIQRLSAATVQTGARPVSDAGTSPIWFTAAAKSPAPHAPLGKSVLIVAPGAARIGQSIELDHCCAHAAKALHAAGRQVVMVSANPAPAVGMGDVDRTYVDPLTTEDLKAICRIEKPEGVILQFGGYRAMDLAAALNAFGFPVLGTPHATIALCQDRLRFSALLTDLGIPHPQIGVAKTPDAAMDLAESIGYPLLAAAISDHQGRRRTILMDACGLEQYVMETLVSADAPLLLEQFIEYAIEVEADALCDGQAVYVPAVMEHIELAGVHSGDSAMVVPPYSTPPRHVETIGAIVDKIALELGIKGVLNTRFAVLNDTVYLLEVRPWACRTLPMISKICNVPMAQRAVEIMLGMTLDEMNLQRCLLPHYAIRSSVFPFDTFTEADPLLGPRMCSTGQAMIMAAGFGMSYFNSQEAAGPPLPLEGKVLITVTDTDKPSILEPARLFKEMGFGIQATRGTHAFLKKNGIEAQLVKKLGFGRPDLVDAIKTGEVVLVINTPSGSQSQQDDAYIRKTAIRYQIPNITTPAGALAAAKGIAARKRGQDALRTLQSYVRAINRH